MSSLKQVVPVESVRRNGQHRKTDRTSDPKRTQEAQRISEIRYRRLFEAARDGILLLNASTLKITDVNPFLTELLGYSRDEFVGKELWEIGFFGDKKASQGAFREVQTNGYIRYEDLPLKTKSGKVREVEFVSNLYQEDQQQVIQCNIRDITDRKQAEEERSTLLERAESARAEADLASNAKDEFLALLSHELRTPLTSILGWSQMLTDGDLDAEASKHALEIIVRNARAQHQLIDDLLDISRIITGKLRLEVLPVELVPIICDVVDSVRPAADARGIILQVASDPRSSPISGDADRLQQIIWNLLTNAIKFTPKRGRVKVWFERVESHVEVTVNDNGQGISPDLLPHVFDRFRQSDSSSTRRHSGMGLGLFIVRQLVELHGGTVTADSLGEGKGTTVKVIFPMMSVQHEVSNARMARPVFDSHTRTDTQPSLANLRVLVVDDERDARKLVAAVLTGRGAQVVSVGSAVEALQEMERQPFDVLVSDIGMPDIDGYALIDKVRQLAPELGGRIPAAALTAYAGVDNRVRVLSVGYQMHISKPVEPAELVSVVTNIAKGYVRPVAFHLKSRQ